MALAATMTLLGSVLGWAEAGPAGALAALLLVALASGGAVTLALLGPLRRTREALTASLRREEESRAHLDTALALSPVGCAFLDTELRCVRVSPALAAMDGVPESEHVGRRLSEVLPGLGAALEARLRRALESDGPILDTTLQVEVASSPGEPRHWFGGYAPVRVGGRLLGVVATWVEMSERMRAEHSLRESEDRLNALTRSLATDRRLADDLRLKLASSFKRSAQEWSETFNAVASPLVVLDVEGRVQRMNEAARALLGTERDVTGESLAAIASGQLWRGALQLAEEVRQSTTALTRPVHDEKSQRTWEVSASMVAGSDAQGTRIILVAQEVTRLLELQASLRRSETMAALGALVGGVAHEVKNPLFSISATMDAMEATFHGQAEAKPFLDVMRNEVRRIDRLVRELFEYGRPTRADFTEGALQDVLSEALSACELVREQAGVDIVPPSAPEPLRMNMDAPRLFHAFRNVIENAVQHSPAGSRVRLSLEAVERDGARWAEFSVHDAGPGFREEDLPHAFEPFFSRRRGGTGLGLAIVQRIVEEHGGTAHLQNHPSGGARVVLRLPLSSPTLHTAPTVLAS